MAGHGIEVEFTSEDFAVIRMKRGENRLNEDFLDAFSAALDKVERNLSCRALITTGEGRFFSNGLDLPNIQNIETMQSILKKVQALLCRVLTFPMPTVAAINGHAFAGGGFLALAHDFRIMRTGFGWISWNEIFMRMRIPDYLFELLRTKVPPGTAVLQAVVYGRRFTAEEASKLGIVDIATGPGALLQEAKMLATKFQGREPYDRKAMSEFKTDLYRHLIDMPPAMFAKSRL